MISPPIKTIPAEAKVSQATWLDGSEAKQASKTASEIWSHNLSGCPSPTDSEVKRYLFSFIFNPSLGKIISNS